MDSGFNIPSSADAVLPEGNFIEIGRSERFRYFKTRRNGIVLFVKTPTEDYSHDLLTSEALKKEFLFGYGLNHPGFVRYYSHEENRLYEEFVEGDSLQNLIDNDDIRLHQKDFIENICRQIFEALRYLHSNGMVHLDLKPHNIMVSRLGNQVKIIDLSCAQNISDNSTSGYTKGYEAPEQLEGNANVTTDIFQAGKIVGELSQLAKCHRKWKNFVDKSTARHPDNRFKSAEDAIKAIPKHKRINYPLLLFMISLVAILILLFDLHFRQVESDAIVKETMHADLPENDEGEDNNITIREEIKPVQTKLPETALQSPYQKAMETEKEIDRKINHKIDEVLSQEVNPLYEKMLSDDEIRMNEESSRQFNHLRAKALDQLIAYGEELCEEYPDHSSYIMERIVKAVETRYSLMLLKLYPSD